MAIGGMNTASFDLNARREEILAHAGFWRRSEECQLLRDGKLRPSALVAATLPFEYALNNTDFEQGVGVHFVGWEFYDRGHKTWDKPFWTAWRLDAEAEMERIMRTPEITASRRFDALCDFLAGGPGRRGLLRDLNQNPHSSLALTADAVRAGSVPEVRVREELALAGFGRYGPDKPEPASPWLELEV